jgi:hypothetical protein
MRRYADPEEVAQGEWESLLPADSFPDLVFSYSDR